MNNHPSLDIIEAGYQILFRWKKAEETLRSKLYIEAEVCYAETTVSLMNQSNLMPVNITSLDHHSFIQLDQPIKTSL